MILLVLFVDNLMYRLHNVVVNVVSCGSIAFSRVNGR